MVEAQSHQFGAVHYAGPSGADDHCHAIGPGQPDSLFCFLKLPRSASVFHEGNVVFGQGPDDIVAAAVAFGGAAAVDEHYFMAFGYFENGLPDVVAEEKFRVVSENEVFHLSVVFSSSYSLFQAFRVCVDPVQFLRDVDPLRSYPTRKACRAFRKFASCELSGTLPSFRHLL